MDNLHETAMIAYNNASEKLQRAANKFFESMDHNKDGKISLEEFSQFMKENGLEDLNNDHFFNDLITDESGTLGFNQVVTVFYIIDSEMPCCGQCGSFVASSYFSCKKCFNENTFSVCSTCFQGRNYSHKHDSECFLEIHALLKSKKKSKRKAALHAFLIGIEVGVTAFHFCNIM